MAVRRPRATKKPISASRQGTDQSHFFGNCDKYKIRNRHRDKTGTAQAGTAPGCATVGNCHERLNDLERASGRIEPGVQPGIDAELHYIEKEIPGITGRNQGNQTDEQDAFFPGSNEQDDCVRKMKMNAVPRSCWMASSSNATPSLPLSASSGSGRRLSGRRSAR